MTKEEQWKREAEIKLDELDDRGFDFDNWSISDAYERGYCDCAEPREKRIAELEAQIGKMKVKWHDLEKDPNDLPKNCKTMCICLGDFGSKYQPVPQVCIGYCDSLGWSDYMGSSLYSTVRYWCELPK